MERFCWVLISSAVSIHDLRCKQLESKGKNISLYASWNIEVHNRTNECVMTTLKPTKSKPCTLNTIVHTINMHDKNSHHIRTIQQFEKIKRTNICIHTNLNCRQKYMDYFDLCS
jgi:hypothetical protein